MTIGLAENREATVEDLINAGSTYGFSVEKTEATRNCLSVNVSSTKIRTALENGEMLTAKAYLNRPYRLSGKVIKGEMIGRTIGFKLANLHIAEEYKLFPCDGVYLVKSILTIAKIFGMMNIGFRPTLKRKEAFI